MLNASLGNSTLQIDELLRLFPTQINYVGSALFNLHIYRQWQIHDATQDRLTCRLHR